MREILSVLVLDLSLKLFLPQLVAHICAQRKNDFTLSIGNPDILDRNSIRKELRARCAKFRKWCTDENW